jgi:hypothetical protein
MNYHPPYDDDRRNKADKIFEAAGFTPASLGDFGAEIAGAIADFNERYMVVNEAGKAFIYQRGYDEVRKRRWYYRLQVADFKTLHMNNLVQIGVDQKGNPVTKSVADVWLRHPDRRQYINGVKFDPEGSRDEPGVLNLWEDFDVKPAPGDWSLMHEHIRNVVCAGDPVLLHYLIRWMARMVQQPARQGEVAVVMRGPRGAGKTIVANALKRIIGQHSLTISNSKHLVGNFNAHLRDCIFLFADEAFFAGDKAHVGVLNSLITDDTLTVEGKGANIVQAPNFLHVMMASNESWVIPAATDERRYCMLDVPGTKRGDHAYFAAIAAQMEAGGDAAMLHYLLALDLTDFNVRAVPETEALQQQKKMSLGTTDAWWRECLGRGYVWQSKLGLEDVFAAWYDKVTKELLMKSYTEFAKARGERRPLALEDLGKYFTKLGAKASRPRNVIVGEHMTEVETTPYGGTARKAKPIIHPHAYAFTVGTLDQARVAFCKHTGLTFEWDCADND